MDSRKDKCLQGRYAKKMFLAMEQLASRADADWAAHEDPNCSTTAAFIITATEAVQTRRHGEGLAEASEDIGSTAVWLLRSTEADRCNDEIGLRKQEKTEARLIQAEPWYWRGRICTGG